MHNKSKNLCTGSVASVQFRVRLLLLAWSLTSMETTGEFLLVPKIQFLFVIGSVSFGLLEQKLETRLQTYFMRLERKIVKSKLINLILLITFMQVKWPCNYKFCRTFKFSTHRFLFVSLVGVAS